MEAGYDYLLLRSRVQHRLIKFSGIFLFALGAVLLSAGGAYYGYALKAGAELDQLNYQATSPSTTDQSSTLSGSRSSTRNNPSSNAGSQNPGGVTSPGAGSSASPDASGSNVPGASSPSNPASSGVSSPANSLSAALIAGQQLYPGEFLSPQSWSSPLAYEPDAYQQAKLLDGFTPVQPGQAHPIGSQDPATRIIVPAINVDSSVSELQVLDLGDSRAYQTPNNTVGHIPQTAHPGESGSAWMFGHLESPLRGEGSVFFELPNIPGMLRNGDTVYIITDNGQQQSLYEVTGTQVVHQNDLRLYDTGEATIHLVACVPRLVYDHRLIVTGKLVGYK